MTSRVDCFAGVSCGLEVAEVRGVAKNSLSAVIGDRTDVGLTGVDASGIIIFSGGALGVDGALGVAERSFDSAPLTVGCANPKGSSSVAGSAATASAAGGSEFITNGD
jgi:hypothetical protein